MHVLDKYWQKKALLQDLVSTTYVHQIRFDSNPRSHSKCQSPQNQATLCHRLLLHHGVHRTHIPLRILEFLNQTMLALAVLLSHHLSVRFLNFLHTDPHIS